MIASSMILIGSLLILGLAGYWFIRAALAERRVAELESEFERSWVRGEERARRLIVCQSRLLRIISLETPNMAHVGKKVVAIARGDI